MSGLNNYINQINIVRQIPVFSKLNWFDVQKIARRSVLAEYSKGDFIRLEGDPADFFYCVISGRVQAYRLNAQGEKINIDFMHRGMFFGIVSVFTGKSHSMTFQAINDSVILKISRADFHDILKVIPNLGVFFSESLSRRMRRHLEGQKTIFESTILSIYSPVKKTGSSTYAVNLASNLYKETGKKVILVKFIEEETDKSESNTPHFIFRDIPDQYEKIKSYVKTNEDAIDYLPVGFDIQDKASLKKKISPFVSHLVNEYTYVVVDLPTQMDDLVLEALAQSDVVHLLTLNNKNCLAQTHDVIERLKTLRKEHFHKEKIKIVIRSKYSRDEISYKEINRRLTFDIYALLPDFEHNQEESKAIEYQRVIRRIARELGGVLVGLALGGGAALGLSHIGVLKELEKENISIDVISGSSMGAVIGSLWAIGMSIERIEQEARQFERKLSLFQLLDPVFPVSGFIRGRAIRRWLKRYLGDKTFYNTKVPLKIVAYDLLHRQDIVISSGSILDAVCQSVAIPGVINPTKKDGKIIIDGGVLNPVPVNVLAGEGIKKIIAVNVLKSPEDVVQGYEIMQKRLEEKRNIPFKERPFHYVMFRLNEFMKKLLSPTISDIIVLTLQASEYQIAEQSMKQADVQIHPNIPDVDWYELYRVRELIKSGEDATKNKIEEIKQLVSK